MTWQAKFPSQQTPDRKAWFRRLTTGLALGFLALCGLVALVVPPAGARPAYAPYQALGTSVVISEFRTTGPGSATDEFVEIFNPTQNQIPIGGWKIRRSPGTGGTPVDQVTFPAGATIDAGQFILITHATGYTGSTPADYTYSIGIADDGGIAVTLNDNTVIDQVGMSDITVFGEGDWLDPLTGAQDRSYIRNPNGTDGVCHDNNNNATDFVIQNPSDPQNSLSPITPCPAPTSTPPWERRLLINEIAWGGTQADDTLAQWIELYNPGADLDLTGLYLRIPDKGDIPLSGTLPAGGYYLIERNEADTDVTANLVVAFPLLDPTGDSLYLYAPGDILIDSANANGGPWPAGNRFFSYDSMERRSNEPDSDDAWLTFDPSTYTGTTALDRLGNSINGSPGQPNSPGLVSTPTSTPSPTSTATATPTRTITATPAASMSIIINELAWMGTVHSSDDEWIELYNPGSVAIDLSGWKITLNDAALITIETGKTIGPGQYFLLERGSDATSAAEDQVFSGAISNDGKKMKLLSPSGQVIDSANLNGGGWPAGNNTTKCSMERRGTTFADTDTAWITNTGMPKVAQDAAGNWICGTPGYRNWAYDVTPTPSPVKSLTPSRTPTKTRTPAPNRATPEPIVINEILPHARADYNGDGVIDSGDEFIELINLGGAAVSLKNWKIDDQDGDSNPYVIGDVTLQPGTRFPLFTSQTGILLSDGGDSVRLYKSNGTIADAFSYGLLKELDRTWCRYPDGKFIPAGQSNWTFGCQPSPGAANELAATERIGAEELPFICRSPKLPFGIYLTECDRLGLWNWNSAQTPLPLLPPYLEADGVLFIFE